MIKIVVVVIILIIGGIGVFLFTEKQTIPLQQEKNQTKEEQSYASPESIARVEVIAEKLDTPWGMAFLPNGELLVTERMGRVRRIDTNTVLDAEPVATLPSVQEIGEGGLLGIAIDPDFVSNNFVYLYYTYSASSTNTLNRVVRMEFRDNTLVDEVTILDRIPGAANHNGGRIAFGPDKHLYVTTGDAQEPSLSQNTSSLAGKILRVTRDGKAVVGNPFNSPVYSYGHRNSQGIAWDDQNKLWSTEHGRSGIQSGLDELNRIDMGGNYGWPDSQGDEVAEGTIGPVSHSGSFSTWAPGGIAYINNSLFFTGLRGRAVYQVPLENGSATSVGEYFKNEYGRIRDVVVGPDQMLYIATSNRDGRGTPVDTDDRIIRINPAKL